MPKNATSFGEKSGNRRGRGPAKGSGGAPPHTFVERMRLLADRKETVKRLEDALDNADPRVFLAAWADVANRAYGKAPETIEHSGTVDHRVQVWQLGNRKVAF